MKLYSKDGRPLLDITSIEREGENLVCRVKVVGAMSMVVYVRPEEAWEIKKVLGKGVIGFLPKFLWKGWKARRAGRKNAAAP
ncbi:MAG: hypothetical protein QHH27_05710 [Clostridia bacterium]|jgi:hypothetical protein|nr:hypothetical protein [Clostridia bacterium]MDH7573032.1 hypothetical protein [Clostridia bacterium]